MTSYVRAGNWTNKDWETRRGRLQQVIEDQVQARQKILVFATLAGAHLWGLDSSTSDTDVRGVYLDNTVEVLQLTEGSDNFEFKVDEVEGQFYELKKYLRMLSRSNGNAIAMTLSPYPIYPDLISIMQWRHLAQLFITKKLQGYYCGYAKSQQKRSVKERGGKGFIYTYRELLAGLYLMRYGTMINTLEGLLHEATIAGWYGDGVLYKYYIPERGNKIGPIEEGDWKIALQEWEDLTALLHKEADASDLPEGPEKTGGIKACNGTLFNYRVRNLLSQECGKALFS